MQYRALRVALAATFAFTSTLSFAQTQSSACQDANLSVSGCYGPFSGMTVVNTNVTFNQPAVESGTPVDVSGVAISNLTGAKPTFAHFMPWFRVADQQPSYPVPQNGYYRTVNNHVEVGYDSSSPITIRRQLTDMTRRGFAGLVIDWYGPFDGSGNPRFENTVTLGARDALDNCSPTTVPCGLKMAIVEDQGAWFGNYLSSSGYTPVGPCQSYEQNPSGDMTNCILTHIRNDLRFTETNYVTPTRYVKINSSKQLDSSTSGNPIVMFFENTASWGSGTQWSTVWSNVLIEANSMSPPMRLMFRNEGGFTKVGSSGGAFAWVNTDTSGNPAVGYSYLDSFYNAATNTYPSQLAFGAVYKGYDERMSGQPGQIQRGFNTRQECGTVWYTTTYGKARTQTGAPFLQVATWNDYDEGTEIESGIDNCVNAGSYSASRGTDGGGDYLQFAFSFNPAFPDQEKTINHFEILASKNGAPAVNVGSVATTCNYSSPTLACKTYPHAYEYILQDGSTYVLSMKAVGINSVRNHTFSGFVWTTTDQTCDELCQAERTCWDSGGWWGWFQGEFGCHYSSPIIIDVRREGFKLTNAGNGVRFDLAADGNPMQVAWTDSRYHNAFLALDRNGNGMIDSGRELFGNYTPQPASDDPNGYRALAVFDEPANGGNGDGVIDASDAIFPALRLWIDGNHNGVSEHAELHSLPALSVTSISVRYQVTGRQDEHGNLLRYQAIVTGGPGHSGPAPVSYDVILRSNARRR